MLGDTDNKTKKLDVSALSPEQKRQLLAEIKKRKEASLEALKLSDRDKELQCNGFNATEVVFDSETILADLEKSFEANASGLALIDGKETLTYQELGRRVNQFCNKLLAEGVQKGDLIPILLPQSLDMFISILAVLKLGATYIPLDEKFPEMRVKSILTISQATFGIGNFSSSLNIRQIDLSNLENYSADFQSPQISSTDLAYIIFTSGSTGTPKGVKISHKALNNLSHWFIDRFSVKAEDITSKFAGAAFDVSVAEIFPFLLKGSCIHILCEELKQDPWSVNNYFNENKVNICFLPTQFCQLFMELENYSLETVITAGEKLNRYQKQNYKLYNLYGPTENTVYTTCFEVRENSLNIPIGKPIANNQLYILDEKQNLLPLGHKGELYISGDQLAEGYLNDPDLTEQKFIPHPFLAGKKIYRSGDLCSFLETGDILYHDRLDNQVKIRGYRIELGEIEACMLQYNEITKCAVLAKESEDKTKELVLYYESQTELNTLNLRNFLAGFLPDYMLPSNFIYVQQFQLTTSGKIDRFALPEPKDVLLTSASEYIEPLTETEKELCSLCETLLKQPRIGTDDNFFVLGGHSLKIIQMISNIHRIWGIELPPSAVFETPTVKGLAEYIDKSLNKEIEQVDEIGFLLNKPDMPALFFFPSAGAFALTYTALAAQIDSHSFFGLNFIEQEDRMDQYVSYLKKIQPKGSFLLGGYSAGGNLAFRIAHELEKRGEKVSCLLFFDVPYRKEPIILSPEKVKLRAKAFIYGSAGENNSDFLENSPLRKKVEEKVEAYLNFIYFKKDEGIIEAPIYLIKSNEVVPDHVHDRRSDWKNATKSSFTVFQGVGDHDNMLKAGNLTKNAEIFKSCLQIEH